MSLKEDVALLELYGVRFESLVDAAYQKIVDEERNAYRVPPDITLNSQPFWLDRNAVKGDIIDSTCRYVEDVDPRRFVYREGPNGIEKAWLLPESEEQP